MNSKVVFDNCPPNVSFTENIFSMRQCGLSMSDEEGQLLFYTNCQQVATADNQIMANGDSLNFEAWVELYGDTVNLEYYLTSNGYGKGARNIQGALALPDPADENIFYVFHINVGAIDESMVYSQGTHLLCTKIDMSEEEGKGAVVEKNKIILEDIIIDGGLSAARHANGRDWWLVFFRFGEPKYYRVLVTEGGVSGAWLEELNASIELDALGPSVFSFDGSKLAVVAADLNDQAQQKLYILDFDRCDGKFFNTKEVEYGNGVFWDGRVINMYSYGATISPNSRYLYVSDRFNYFQVDLWSDDPEASMINFADEDGFYDDWDPEYYSSFGLFGFSGLGPDGKVYATTVGLTDYFHVIERPNNYGVSCKMEQHSFKVLGINQYAVPNHPNYRLGPLEGSGCDTLGIQKAVFIHAHPYPNEGCVGGDTHFEVTAFGTGKSYQWQASNDGGLIWVNLIDGFHFVGTTTEYMTIKKILAEYDGMQFRCVVAGNASTEMSRPAPLTVIGYLPIADFSFEQDLDSLHFTNLSEGYEYVEYFFGDGESSTLPNARHLYLATGTYAVMLVATNACGSDTLTKEVIIEPIFADLEVSPIYGCVPLEVTVTSRSAYRINPHTFYLEGAISGYISSRLRSLTFTFPNPGVFDVHYYVESLDGETDTLVLEDYITISQYPGTNPTAEIELQQNGNTISLNAPFDLADSYTWFLVNGDTLSGQMAEYTFTNPGLYEVQLETANHCGMATGSVGVLVGGLQAAFTSNQQQGCAPFSVQFENRTDFFGASYVWQFPGGQPASSIEENPVVAYEESGIYEVVLIARADSLSDTLVQTAFIEVLANECPQANIFAQADGLEITLWTDCTNGTSYTWLLGDGTSPVSTPGVVHQYGEVGTFMVTLFVEGPCGIDTSSIEVNITGPNTTDFSQRQKHVSLVPNPASGQVRAISENGFANGASLTVFNALGAQVLEMKKVVWKQQEEVLLDGLASGVYFFRFENAGGAVQVGKLVVE